MIDRADEKRKPVVPRPILDDREYAELDDLSKRYEKLTTPGRIVRMAKRASAIVPDGVRDAFAQVGTAISEQELYEQAFRLVGVASKVLEEQAARITVSEESVIKGINAVSKAADVESLEEVCRIRAYDVSRAANKKYIQHIAAALVEGGGTGVAGFAGIPFSLVLSTFLYYRAVQSIAMSYGYDVKNDPAELVIASDVFASALSPTSKGAKGVSNNVAKFMAISAVEGVGQTAKKTWTAMIERGGPALLLAQMRSLANAAAKKALENAGKKGLENSIFREIFEQAGRRLTLKAIQRAAPVVSAGIGAMIDTAQMSTVLQYADIFYHKRFLIEKKERVSRLFGISQETADVVETEALIVREGQDGLELDGEAQEIESDDDRTVAGTEYPL